MESSPSDLFARFSLRAKTKLVVLGSLQRVMKDHLSSLTFIEHVSQTNLLRSEISRSGSSREAAADVATVAAVRRWFWSRKPDAGFILWDFPATLLHAMIFDEWLEVRQEELDAVILGEGSFSSLDLIKHYRNHGLLQKAEDISIVV